MSLGPSHLALPVSSGALVASCEIDVGVAAMHMAIAQYEHAANFTGDIIAGNSSQRIKHVGIGPKNLTSQTPNPPDEET
jgi:hypothetical protein